MQGMISHHAQAVTMSSFADANGASSEVRVLAGRITVAQTDEIAFMKTWLGKRKQTVPAGDMEAMAHAHHAGMDMSATGAAGGTSSMMPGMLTTAQMDTLKTAKGREYHFAAENAETRGKWLTSIGNASYTNMYQRTREAVKFLDRCKELVAPFVVSLHLAEQERERARFFGRIEAGDLEALAEFVADGDDDAAFVSDDEAAAAAAEAGDDEGDFEDDGDDADDHALPAEEGEWCVIS
mgnify:CR=1 FL=1